MKQYYPELDINKGFAILFIIFGHSICQFPINLAEKSTRLIPYVNSFSLPLFFLASGFLFSQKEIWRFFLYKKTKRLLIPYIVFCLCTIVLRMTFSSFTHSEAPSMSEAFIRIITGGYYWFLYALFIIMSICKALNRKYVLVGIAIVSFFLHSANLPLPGIINRIVHYLPYFVAGIFLKRRYVDITKYISTYKYQILISAIAVFVITIEFGNYNPYLESIKAVAGCIIIWQVSICITTVHHNSRCSSLLTYFGKHSLQFYLNHLLIMLPCYYAASRIPTHIAIIQLLFIFCTSVFASWVMLLAEKRFKPLHCLFGL